jgi:hypothetical protein
MSSGPLVYPMALPLVPCSKFDLVPIIILKRNFEIIIIPKSYNVLKRKNTKA